MLSWCKRHDQFTPLSAPSVMLHPDGPILQPTSFPESSLYLEVERGPWERGFLQPAEVGHGSKCSLGGITDQSFYLDTSLRTYKVQEANMFTEYFKLCPSRANI